LRAAFVAKLVAGRTNRVRIRAGGGEIAEPTLMPGAYRRNRDRIECLAQDSLAQSSNDGVRRALHQPIESSRVVNSRCGTVTMRADRGVR
jgi:hypothetical protein